MVPLVKSFPFIILLRLGAIATTLATAHPNRQGLAIKWENVNRMEAFVAGRP